MTAKPELDARHAVNAATVSSVQDFEWKDEEDIKNEINLGAEIEVGGFKAREDIHNTFDISSLKRIC